MSVGTPHPDGRRARRAWPWTLGLSLTLAAPAAHAAPAAPAAAAQDVPHFEAGRLAEGSHRYRVSVGGNRVGTVTTMLERKARNGRPALRASSRFETSEGQTQDVEVWFDAETFQPIETRGTADRGGITVRIALEYAGGRVHGAIELEGPDTAGTPTSAVHPVDTALPAGTLDQNQLRYALLGVPLEVGQTLEIPIFDVTTAELETLALRGAGFEAVEVPAGDFRALRVEMTGGNVPMTWYVTPEPPRRIVRQDFEAGGTRVRVELLP